MTARVAVIGLGYFSRFHLAAWVAEPGCRIVAATDLDPARRERAGTGFGVPVVPDVDAALGEGPDIVDIVAPPPAHAALVAQAIARGRIVICQKPFCTSPAEARATAQIAEAAGATLVIHENFRFQPWHRTIRAFLGTGEMGQVYTARFALRPGDGRGEGAYLDRQPAFRSMERLLIQETGVHFIDLFRWLFGDIEGVYAAARRLNPAIRAEDAVFLILDHAGGAQSVFDGNRLSDHATDNPRRTMGEMVIEGEGGTLTLDGAGRVRFRAFGSADAREIPLVAPVDDGSFGGGCTAALISHVAARRDRPETIENRVSDYLPVIEATEAAYRSAATGRRITLPGTPV